MEQTNTITLSPEAEAFVADRVEAGDFDDANAVVSAALMLLEERLSEANDLRLLLAEGDSAISRGDVKVYLPGQLSAELRAELLARGTTG
jgi:putative addiction module CopG family antidote